MQKQTSHGIIHHQTLDRKTDYLYRISLKGLIRNENGEVLVVKETGRDWWDLPGGGMDHSESIKLAIAREMKEEINLESGFTYTIIAVDEPRYLDLYGFWQIRLVYELKPEEMIFSAGEDGDEIAFMAAEVFKDSDSAAERRIYKYARIASQSGL